MIKKTVSCCASIQYKDVDPDDVHSIFIERLAEVEKCLKECGVENVEFKRKYYDIFFFDDFGIDGYDVQKYQVSMTYEFFLPDETKAPSIIKALTAKGYNPFLSYSESQENIK